jgi:hypothetical protein
MPVSQKSSKIETKGSSFHTGSEKASSKSSVESASEEDSDESLLSDELLLSEDSLSDSSNALHDVAHSSFDTS